MSTAPGFRPSVWARLLPWERRRFLVVFAVIGVAAALRIRPLQSLGPSLLSASRFDRDGDRWVRLTAEDHGAGIPPEVAARIFEPFDTTKDLDKGTGQGLSISHGIVKEHRGELRFETEPGRCTRFHVDLRAAS